MEEKKSYEQKATEVLDKWFNSLPVGTEFTEEDVERVLAEARIDGDD